MRRINAEAKTSAFLIAAVACFIAVSLTEALAQSSRPMTSVYRRIDEMNRQSEKIERDKMSRELKGGDRKDVNAKQTKVIEAQLKEDLEGIQLAYNQIIVKLQAKEKLDRDFILVVNADVKKHAARLIKNLSFPQPKADEITEADRENSEDLKALLLSLCKNIYSFITNPVFDAPAVLEIERAKTARRNLDKIIELSNQIQERSETQTDP